MNECFLLRYIALCLLGICAMPCVLAIDFIGRVVDKSSREPLESAVLKWMSADGRVILSFPTEIDGSFRLTIDSIPAKLSVGYIGYNDRIIPGDSLTPGQEMVIELEPSSVTDLNNVTITASTRTVKGNVESFLITDEMRKNKVSAIDLISGLPGFSVDPLTESVRSGMLTDIKILVDGKEVSKSYYTSINPERIKKIELIRNSSGKFSQYPALLNVVLKKGYEGIDLNLNGRYIQMLCDAPADRENISASLSSSFRRWDYFISGDFGRMSTDKIIGRQLEIPDLVEVKVPMCAPEDPGNTTRSVKTTANAGVSFEISRDHNVAGQFLYDRIDDKNRNLSLIEIDAVSDVEDIRRTYGSDNYVGSISYEGRIADKVSINADVTYNSYHISEKQNVVDGNDFYEIQLKGDKDYISGFGKMDYDITRNWSLSAGYEYTHRHYGTVGEDGDISSYTETRHRPVVDAVFSYGGFSGTAGLSYLDIYSRNGHDSSHVRSFLPKVSLNWSPSSRFSLSADYYTLTEYPNLDLLSDQRWVVSERIWHSGNPKLRASTMHYAEVRMKLFRCLTFSYMFRKSRNDVSSVYDVIDEGVPGLLGSYLNTDFIHQYAGLQFSKGFSDDIYVDVTGNYQWYRRKWHNNSGAGRTWYLDMSASWNVLGSGYMAGLSFFLRDDRMPVPQGYETGHQETLLLSGRKLFFNNRLSIMVGVNIPTGFLSHTNRTMISGT